MQASALQKMRFSSENPRKQTTETVKEPEGNEPLSAGVSLKISFVGCDVSVVPKVYHVCGVRHT